MRKFSLTALAATLSFAIEPVVSTQWLAKHLHDKDLVILNLSQPKALSQELSTK